MTGKAQDRRINLLSRISIEKKKKKKRHHPGVGNSGTSETNGEDSMFPVDPSRCRIYSQWSW